MEELKKYSKKRFIREKNHGGRQIKSLPENDIIMKLSGTRVYQTGKIYVHEKTPYEIPEKLGDLVADFLTEYFGDQNFNRFKHSEL